MGVRQQFPTLSEDVSAPSMRPRLSEELQLEARCRVSVSRFADRSRLSRLVTLGASGLVAVWGLGSQAPGEVTGPAPLPTPPVRLPGAAPE